MPATCRTFVLLLLASCTAAVDDPCSGKPDETVLGLGCRSYTNCTGGVGAVVDCDYSKGLAFDYETGQCQAWETVPPPCGSVNNCTSHPDGLYAILSTDCKYFYTCFGGLFHGANPCNDPPDHGDLVFDEDFQTCNWKWNVPPPRGTA